MICGIYKITSPTGKIYIGQSINIQARIKGYGKLKKSVQTLLFRSIKKHGWDAHKIEILQECEIESLDVFEVYFIKLFNSFNIHRMDLT